MLIFLYYTVILIYLFIHSCIQLVYIEHLLWARNSSHLYKWINIKTTLYKINYIKINFNVYL